MITSFFITFARQTHGKKEIKNNLAFKKIIIVKYSIG